MMKELNIKDKQKYLDENYPFEGTPRLTDEKFNCDDDYAELFIEG